MAGTAGAALASGLVGPMVERYDPDNLLSFDDDFDGIVDRVDPSRL